MDIMEVFIGTLSKYIGTCRFIAIGYIRLLVIAASDSIVPFGACYHHINQVR